MLIFRIYLLSNTRASLQINCTILDPTTVHNSKTHPMILDMFMVMRVKVKVKVKVKVTL